MRGMCTTCGRPAEAGYVNRAAGERCVDPIHASCVECGDVLDGSSIGAVCSACIAGYGDEDDVTGAKLTRAEVAARIALGQDNPFTTTSYFDRPDRVWVHRLEESRDKFVNFLHVDTNTGRVTWAQDWAQVTELVVAGVCRAVGAGLGTYGHTDVYLA